MTEDKIKSINNLLEAQGMDGTWNYNDYFHGMYNGMELICSIIEDREPVFKDDPSEWIENKGDK